MILKMSVTLAECIMTVVVPAAVASSAAMSFVDMPPVPRDVPRVEVDTRNANMSINSMTWEERAYLAVSPSQCRVRLSQASHRDYYGGCLCICTP